MWIEYLVKTKFQYGPQSTEYIYKINRDECKAEINRLHNKMQYDTLLHKK